MDKHVLVLINYGTYIVHGDKYVKHISYISKFQYSNDSAKN